MSIEEGVTKLSDALVSSTSTALERTTSRGGFLAKVTLAGAALTVAPLRFLLKPETAWATISCPSGCSNCCNQCSSSSTCCTSGNSSFCCTTYGTNNCPGGTGMSGWWYAIVPNYICGANARYYIDCNGCGGFCCHCAQDLCGNRKECCNTRQWFNCNETSPYIRCRIVRCTNPGVLYPSQCQTTSAYENTSDDCASCIPCI